MKNKYAAVILATCLTLTACGASIDAKNADKLRTSIHKIGKNMTEAERIDFAQDIFAVYETERRESPEDVRLHNLYDTDDYEVLFSASSEDSELALLFGDVFADLAATAGEELDGKTPGSLSKTADAMRSKSFSHQAETFRQKTEEIKQEISDIQQKQKDYATARDAALAEQETLDKKKSDAFRNVTISSMKMDGRRRVIVEGALEITNTSDTPIRSARGRLRADVNEINDAEYTQSITYKFDPPLAPNASVKKSIQLATVLSIRGKTERIKTFSPYVGKALSVTNPHVTFWSFQSADTQTYQPIEFEMSYDQQRDIDRFEQRSQSCEQAVQSKTELLTAYEKSIAYFEASAKSVPESIDQDFTSTPRYRSRGC